MPEITLSAQAVAMLNIVLNDHSRLLPQNLQPSPVMPYRVPDQIAALEIASIVRWIQTKVVKRDESGRSYVEKWSGTLNKRSILRIQHILKHYEQWGLLTHNCTAYLDLLYSLDGRSVEADLMDVEKE
jgi:hypothetical protein